MYARPPARQCDKRIAKVLSWLYIDNFLDFVTLSQPVTVFANGDGEGAFALPHLWLLDIATLGERESVCVSSLSS